MSETKDKILLVDDDEEIVWMMSAVLRKDYEVFTASDGTAAVSSLEQLDLACVIADHMLPGMNGVELLDRAHELRPAAARVLITASERVNVLKDAVNEARVHRFLSKPLRLGELPALLSSAIREARLQAENSRLVLALGETNEALRRANEGLEAEIRQRTMQLEAAVAQLEGLALRDGLTGLFNHRYAQEALDRELSRAKRHQHPLGLLLIAIDDFRFYNDRHGHLVGDRLLKRLAGLLTGARETVGLGRRSDVVARYANAEFMLILPETHLEGALIKAERIRAAVASHPFEHAREQPAGLLSVSVGVVTYPTDGADKQALLGALGRQVELAKAEGRNRVSAPTPR